ncbi:hypothetical protein CORC01_12102 [Colletotrichum orchidophilum]|uniref:Uncharacterized protein n=1 Tax=Colletotrichum orchidophilum TaxID=1209926 RepID=A0A1G4AU07_9PEZI|nr:uncharacterized protein CORC01_12102 [Colletotrichum orchidophilum]OHE92591.1 hypothetical protein CORC01_12102 [Colletotrichum orchidophilum]
MGRFNDLAKRYLAVLVRITGVKKENPEHNTKVDTKIDAKVDTKVDCCTCCHGLEAHTAPKHKSTVAAKKGWEYRPNTEFPWRLEQVVEKEENWRGTWVLEVKDLRAMDWGTTRVPKADGDGRGGRYQRQPTRHLPFPADGDGYRETLTGGQDDLMVQLGKR